MSLPVPSLLVEVDVLDGLMTELDVMPCMSVAVAREKLGSE